MCSKAFHRNTRISITNDQFLSRSSLSKSSKSASSQYVTDERKNAKNVNSELEKQEEEEEEEEEERIKNDSNNNNNKNNERTSQQSVAWKFAFALSFFAFTQFFSSVDRIPKALAANDQRERTVSSSNRTKGKKRQKRNSFVRQAAESVGPCVVRVDALLPSHTNRQSKGTNVIAGGGADGTSTNDAGIDSSNSNTSNSNGGNANLGGGCGLVLDAKLGRVVTNAHVVGDAQKVRVTFTDGRTYIASVIGVDQTADIALLKLNLRASHVLPMCVIGDSDDVDVGDSAVAVGNPFGLDNSVALGIISNLARTSTELGIPERRSVEFFQTDCAINPGNSGGPLVNEFGEVVAINAAIRADADGIGFAIPINTVRTVADALARGEIIARPYLGIDMATLLEGNNSTNSAESDSSPPREGALIVRVSENSPASAAGVRVGDVIVDCNGEAVIDANQVRRIVRESTPGSILRIVVWRVCAIETIDVSVGDVSFGRTQTAHSSNDNNTHRQKKDSKKGELTIAPPGLGVQRRA